MLKALVVEDEEDIKQLSRDELEDKGYQVIEACNGEIGLEQATAEIPNIVNQYILGV
jgi:DNA-binding response OmpR family regulator